MYGEATSLAEQGKWSEAYETMQFTQTRLNRTLVEENTFLQNLVLGLAGWIIVIVLIIYYFKRETKLTPHSYTL